MAQFFIQGLTADGKPFRPSDWSDRLCGVMSPFRPGGATPGSHLSYSPYVVPTLIGDVRCVVVDERLKDLEPMAWAFLESFARDNGLEMSEACVMPDLKPTTKPTDKPTIKPVTNAATSP